MAYDSLSEIPRNTSWIVFLLGIVGSLINYTKRNRLSVVRRILYFFGDTVSSVMLAWISFSLATGAGLNEIYAIGVTGFMAHQGTRAFYIIELLIEKKAGIDIRDKKSEEAEND